MWSWNMFFVVASNVATPCASSANLSSSGERKNAISFG